MGELIFLGILLAICVYFFTLTSGFAVSILDKSGGAAVFPRIVIIFLAVFIIARMVTVLLEKEKKPFAFLELFQGMRLFFFASLVIYILALKPVGYVLTTTAFLVVVINGFYYKVKGNWGSVPAIVVRNMLLVAFVMLMEFFFVRILHIMLPAGIWPGFFH